ncbi:P-loop containing nucleoside triphosphate hydrolase protein [Apodospora peruviana]|uniref:P-loop containing nucleoside triphosphate hydrolase protein n=1 Tax=Apodospora peruviana TaxID=516989 RepID=A0AAE0HVG9_9PEZI|nr:P-loop containing nucleoside triphosphate hydrolase protein [Apodospora peruviana]
MSEPAATRPRKPRTKAKKARRRARPRVHKAGTGSGHLSQSKPLSPVRPRHSQGLSSPISDLALAFGSTIHSHLMQERKAQRKEITSYFRLLPGRVKSKPGEPARVIIGVPGLRRGIPYLEEGDFVCLRQSHHPLDLVYEASVTAVLLAEEEFALCVVDLPADTTHASEIRQTNGTTSYTCRFNVRFPLAMQGPDAMLDVIGRIQDRVLEAKNATSQRSSQCPNWWQSILFPTTADLDDQANQHGTKFDSKFFSGVLSDEEKRAVKDICSHHHRVVPYLISGPPGTGRSTTIVEAALQLIFKVDGMSHILICAASDKAADDLTERLWEWLHPDQMLRLSNRLRPSNGIAPALLPYCKFGCQFVLLKTYKVMVTTYHDAALLMYSSMTNSDLPAVKEGQRTDAIPLAQVPIPPRGHHQRRKRPLKRIRLHWNTLLMDDAEQVIEPATYLPLYVVAPPAQPPSLVYHPLVVIAGDEHLLTPRTTLSPSPLQISLFARLFALPAFADHPRARKFTHRNPVDPAALALRPPLTPFSNLTEHNPRAHPAIVAIRSQLFYSDTLKATPWPTLPDECKLLIWSWWRDPWANNGTSSSRDGEGARLRRKTRWPVLFYDNLSQDTLDRDGRNRFNEHEAQLACDYASDLVQSHLVPAERIAILSPFKRQVQKIFEMTAAADRYGDLLQGVRVGTTETFHRNEGLVVILCVTRSSSEGRGGRSGAWLGHCAAAKRAERCAYYGPIRVDYNWEQGGACAQGS